MEELGKRSVGDDYTISQPYEINKITQRFFALKID